MGWEDEFEPWERLALAQGIVAAQTGLSMPETVEVMHDRRLVELCTLEDLTMRVLERSIRFNDPNQ